jgi:hypothetical protein
MHVLDMLRLAAAAVLVGAKLVGHRYGRTEEVSAVVSLRKYEIQSLLEKQASDGDRQNRAHEPPYFSSILPHDLILSALRLTCQRRLASIRAIFSNVAQPPHLVFAIRRSLKAARSRKPFVDCFLIFVTDHTGFKRVDSSIVDAAGVTAYRRSSLASLFSTLSAIHASHMEFSCCRPRLSCL